MAKVFTKEVLLQVAAAEVGVLLPVNLPSRGRKHIE